MSEIDVLIENALIVDGTGKSPYKGYIGIKRNRIAALGELRSDAVKAIDASGLIASPAFIDDHSHGDSSILFYLLEQVYVFCSKRWDYT